MERLDETLRVSLAVHSSVAVSVARSRSLSSQTGVTAAPAAHADPVCEPARSCVSLMGMGNSFNCGRSRGAAPG